jgi:alpha-D-ribose 1-methylphosphonate 5-triphosphate diphosphatase
MNQVIDKPVAEHQAKENKSEVNELKVNESKVNKSAKNDVIITNAHIVLADEVVYGSLVVQDGIITDISTSLSSVGCAIKNAIDAESDYIIPGLVELHTDNLEKHFSPRPKVTWPGQPAVIAHDAQLIAAGITTVFDAVALGDVNEGSQRIENLHLMLDAITEAKNKQLLRAEHFLHLRCEVCHPDAVDLLTPLVDKDLVRLVSVMDHSPGQRQFTNMDKYRIYYQGKYHLSNDDLEQFMIKQRENSQRYSDQYRREIVAMCQARHIPIASHDDATLAHVEESAAFGMSIAEFPTTAIAAKQSHEQGMLVMMGAPNVVRGGSHSGNIAAHELAAQGVLDILSSDYCPASMLHAAYKLSTLENDYGLSAAINTVTLNPATSVNLDDRGQIAIGKRADLVQMKIVDELPVVGHVYAQGRRVF